MNSKLKTLTAVGGIPPLGGKNSKPRLAGRQAKLKTKNFLVLMIIALAFLLRVYKISEHPAGLNADEAAIGYNAYSLLQTGKDEFGHPWPVNFQSFNDFKPGLYFYLVLPLVKLLGLTELAVRLPSVILGTLTIAVLYFLVREIFGSSFFALSSSLLLAISPWYLHFSRGGWESNAAVFFIVLGVYFFYKALKNSRSFTLCVLSFSLSMYTYHSARVIVPLLGLGLIVLNYKEFIKKISLKMTILFAIFGVVLIIPLGLSFLDKETSSRFSGVGIFADQGPFWRVNELRGQHDDPFSLFPKLIHNKYLEYSLRFIDNYFRHYTGDFLFISGDEIQRSKVPEMGQMYLAEIPFLLLGLYFFLKNKPKHWQFVIYWLIVAPFASALTFQSPHAIRSLNMVIPLVIITAYGLWYTTNILLARRSRFGIGVVVLSCYLVILFPWNIAFYLHQYYVHYPKTYPSAWEYGFSDLVDYVRVNGERFDNVYVTNKYDQPYILFAFYLKYPPEKFQNEAKLTERDKFGFSTVEHFGKYYFGQIDEKKLGESKTMIIGTPEEIPDSATISKRIYFKDNGKEAFRIIEN